MRRLHIRKQDNNRPSRGSVESGGLLPYGLIAPAVIAILALIGFPLVWNVVLAMRDITLIELRDINIFNPFGVTYTLDNFRNVLSTPAFWATLGRTLVYAIVAATLTCLVGLWAAMLVRKPFRGQIIVRTFFLLPYMLPLIALVFSWRTMLHPHFGFINAWLSKIPEYVRIDFLNLRSLDVNVAGMSISLPVAFMIIIIFEVWRHFPLAFLLIDARLKSVSPELEEAAMVDGASILQRFRHVVLPQLAGVIFIFFILRFIWNFYDFNSIYLLTGGGAGTEVVAIQVYNWLTAKSDPGAAAALSFILSLVLVVFLIIYMQAASRVAKRRA